MIVLQRLQVRAFKHLREIDLWFPRRGSVLVEGANEAGKSTLFEAIYFALYGNPLVGEEKLPSLQAIVPHGGGSAAVTLTLLTGETELEITRRVLLGSRHPRQEARLLVRRSGAPEEDIAQVSAVNARVLQELRGLDGNTLRNSCFMEQKALDRIEHLERAEREAAVARLLGLERLIAIEKELTPTREEKDRLADLSAAYEAAVRRREAREADERVALLAEEQRAAQVHAELTRRDALAAARHAHAGEEDTFKRREAALQERVERAEGLRTLQPRIAETRTRLQEAREVEARLAALRAEQRELERIAETDVPAAEARVAQLTALEQALTTATRAHEYAQAALTAAEAEATASIALEEARARLAQAEVAAHQAEAESARAQLGKTLQRWLQVRQAGEMAAHSADAVAQAEQRREQQEGVVRAATTRARAAQLRLGGAALLVALCLALGFIWHLALVLAALAAALCALAGWRCSLALSALHEAMAALREEDRRYIEQQARLDAARSIGEPEEALAALEARLQAAGVAVPTSLAAGQELLATLPPAQVATAAADRQQVATEAMLQRRGERAQAEAALARVQAARGEQREIPMSVLAEQAQGAADALAAVRARLAAAELAADPAALAAARGGAQAELARLRALLARGEGLAQAERECAARVAEVLARAYSAFAQASADARQLGVLARQEVETNATVRDAEERDAEHLAGMLTHLEEVLAAEMRRLDADAAWRALTQLRAEQGALGARQGSAASEYEACIERVRNLLHAAGIAASGDEPRDALLARWPALATADGERLAQIEEELNTAKQRAYAATQMAAELVARLHLDETPLDESACLERLRAAERELRQRDLAADMARQIRTEIIQRVLPETEWHMQAILPELTAGRYRDVELLRGEGGGADLRIRVWDQLAGRYVAKNLFSGGTRDQCSLALRLAFALATLPKELGAMPGFIFLDEPLSAFDAERSQALVTLLTQGTIAERFDQVFLISHSSSIDARSFDYRIFLENGHIAATDLPQASEARELWSAETAVEPAGERA